MMLPRCILILPCLTALLVSLSAFGLTKNVQLLVEMETHANAISRRNNRPIAMPHYEIPLRLMTMNSEVNLDPQIRHALVFEKDGEAYVRWVVNPEDTQWYLKVEDFLRKNNLPADRRTYFTGYQTASRSYILEDPSSHAQFSIKSSTNKTGGLWNDKMQSFRDALDIRMISDFLKRVQLENLFTNLKVMQEPLMFGIPELSQGIVVRELDTLEKNSDFSYIPGFSVLEENVGRNIAERNGSADPASYWSEHYIKPVARAAAELSVKTGIWFESPHSQNFLVEFDREMKPTGRIVIRDLGDIYIARPVMQALGEKQILRDFSNQQDIHYDLTVGFGPLRGNKNPSWVTKDNIAQWQVDFQDAYVAELSRFSGIPSEETNVIFNETRNSEFFSSSTYLESSAWKNYLSKIRSGVRTCEEIFRID